MLELNKKYQKAKKQFICLLESNFSEVNINTKLRNGYELDFKDSLNELKKAKVTLSLSEQVEWMQYFNEQKEKAQALQAEINRTDKEIDKMVYELYGLTEAEIAIVEASV